MTPDDDADASALAARIVAIEAAGLDSAGLRAEWRELMEATAPARPRLVYVAPKIERSEHVGWP